MKSGLDWNLLFGRQLGQNFSSLLLFSFKFRFRAHTNQFVPSRSTQYNTMVT
jgi:hypothetical protein